MNRYSTHRAGTGVNINKPCTTRPARTQPNRPPTQRRYQSDKANHPLSIRTGGVENLADAPSPDGIVLALAGAAQPKLELAPGGNPLTCSSKRANSELAHSPGFWVAISCSFRRGSGPFYMV